MSLLATCSDPPTIVGLVMAVGAGALTSAVVYERVDEAIDVAGGSGRPLIGIAAGALAFFVRDYLVDRRGAKTGKTSAVTIPAPEAAKQSPLDPFWKACLNRL